MWSQHTCPTIGLVRPIFKQVSSTLCDNVEAVAGSHHHLSCRHPKTNLSPHHKTQKNTPHELNTSKSSPQGTAPLNVSVSASIYTRRGRFVSTSSRFFLDMETTCLRLYTGPLMMIWGVSAGEFRWLMRLSLTDPSTHPPTRSLSTPICTSSPSHRPPGRRPRAESLAAGKDDPRANIGSCSHINSHNGDGVSFSPLRAQPDPAQSDPAQPDPA